MKTLKPQKLRTKDWTPLERDVLSAIWDMVFGPVIEALRQEELFNAKPAESLVAAIRAGRVQYNPAKGEFAGKWNRALSDALEGFGAKLDKRSGVYKVAPARVPADVRAAAASYNAAARAAHEKVLGILDVLDENLDMAAGKARIDSAKVVKSVNEGWKESAKGLEVTPEMDAAGRAAFEERCQVTARIAIKNMARDEIAKLREEVKDNAEEGYRSESLAKAIRDRYAIGKERSRFIARQETAMLMSDFREARFREAGVTRYKWSTSGDVRVRTDHKKLNGKVFLYSQPPVVDSATGRRANPGKDFRCFPGDERLHLAHGIEKAFRRRYAGELTLLVLESGKTLRATPNHPVLTQRGWCPIGQLNETDYLIDLSDELRQAGEDNVNHAVSRIDQVFESLSLSFLKLTAPTTGQDFHGDGADGDVDIIDVAGNLKIDRKSGILQRGRQLIFAMSDAFTTCIRGLFQNGLTPGLRLCANGGMSGPGQFLTASRPGELHAKEHGLRASARFESSLNDTPSNDGAGDSKAFGKSELTESRTVGADNGCGIDSHSVLRVRSTFPSIGFNANCSESLRKIIGMKADSLRNIAERPAFRKHLDRVVHVRQQDFSGHVFNLTTKSNWYAMGGFIVHNCRCVDIPILEAVS